MLNVLYLKYIFEFVYLILNKEHIAPKYSPNIIFHYREIVNKYAARTDNHSSRAVWQSGNWE